MTTRREVDKAIERQRAARVPERTTPNVSSMVCADGSFGLRARRNGDAMTVWFCDRGYRERNGVAQDPCVHATRESARACKREVWPKGAVIPPQKVAREYLRTSSGEWVPANHMVQTEDGKWVLRPAEHELAVFGPTEGA